jgi:shikimate kinase/3-dehydroquinate synthase
MNDHIFIYGPPGVGKSTIGKKLAQEYQLPFIDLDQKIVGYAKKPIPKIFTEDGEAHFRQLEQECLSAAINQSPSVIALGGGALLDPENRIMAKEKGRILFLSGHLPVLINRLSSSETMRPLIASDLRQKLKSLLLKRKDHYDSFSLKCETDNRTPEEILWKIEKMLGQFFIKGMGEGYWVKVKSGGATTLGAELSALHGSCSVMLVTDDNVEPLHAGKIMDSLSTAGFETHIHTIPAGEAHKKLESVAAIWESLTTARLDRKSLVIALGGGVVGDLAGFAAATYMRGIDWINIPTTLLAMVDSSIGGKTGFDLPQGKNLIGAFHPPKFVLTDPTLLTTLPENELRNGMAEVLKHGVIDSRQLFEQCNNGFNPPDVYSEKFITEALSVKVKMVQIDPFEKGPRAALNLGHTVGHAIELLSNFQIPHGFAVAIGMVTEAKLAHKIRLTKKAFVHELTTALQQLGLPSEIPPGMDKHKILETMRLDKKTSNKQIHFALPKEIGKIEIGIVIENLEDIFESLE